MSDSAPPTIPWQLAVQLLDSQIQEGAMLARDEDLHKKYDDWFQVTLSIAEKAFGKNSPAFIEIKEVGTEYISSSDKPVLRIERYKRLIRRVVRHLEIQVAILQQPLAPQSYATATSPPPFLHAIAEALFKSCLHCLWS